MRRQVHDTALIDVRLKILERHFSIPEILASKPDPPAIEHYYRSNQIAYPILHARNGAVHLAINPDGKYHSRGLYTQVKMIGQWLRTYNCKRVLELGANRGFNLAWLAGEYPEFELAGVDLIAPPGGQVKMASPGKGTYRIEKADFHNLPFPEAQFDCVFSVESTCFSHNLSILFREAARVLRPGGIFIAFDFFKGEALRHAEERVRKPVELAERGACMPGLSYLPTWIAHAEQAGLTCTGMWDFTHAVMPNLKRFEQYVTWFFSLRPLTSLAKFVLPGPLVRSAIPGYLMPVTMAHRLHRYAGILAVKA